MSTCPTAAEIAKAIDVLRRAIGSTATSDDVIAYPYGLEASAARTLERNGDLTPARIGRRRYVRRSQLLAAVDRLATQQANRPKPTEEDGYAGLVALAGGRK